MMSVRFAAAGLATAGLLAVGAPAAMATPPSGVTGTILADKTVGHTEYVLREILTALPRRS
jgi:hypothetical protein